MQILLSYDVSEKNVEVKNKLLEAGFSDTIEGDTGVSNLPNTTLYIENTEKGYTTEDAFNVLNTITNELNVKLERAISVEINDWYTIIGEPHKRSNGR